MTTSPGRSNVAHAEDNVAAAHSMKPVARDDTPNRCKN